MHPSLEKISTAAEGLLFLSESDYPLEPVYLELTAAIEAQLRALTGRPADTQVETTTPEHFFRNMTNPPPSSTPEQRQRAQQFKDLQEVLEQELEGITVYRLGSRKLDAFILGKLKDGSGYAGLWTKVVET